MILGWIDPKGRMVPLDDPLATMKVGIPRQILWDMAQSEDEDARHKGTNLTATGANGCPRQLAITRMFDVYVNAQAWWVLTAGKLLHEKFGELHALEEVDGQKVWYTEEEDQEKCDLVGQLGGRQVGALVDMVSRNAYHSDHVGPYGDSTVAIWDWKTSMNAAHKWAGKTKQGKQWVTDGKAKEAHMAQLNIGRLLLEQRIGREFEPKEVVMCAWVVSGGWVDTYCDYLTWPEIRQLRTHGQPYAYTYGEIFDVNARMFDEWQEAALPYGGDIDAVPEERKLEIVRALPLYGRQMFQNRYGESSCDRCPVKWMCDQVDGGI